MTTMKTVGGIWNSNEGKDFVAGCEKACASRQTFAAGMTVEAPAAKATYKGPSQG
ncbi:MAG: hypothetical protein PW788_00435 [Micavibrio sp.]|nr:hypothetical protein [Micavibrio sp.]